MCSYHVKYDTPYCCAAVQVHQFLDSLYYCNVQSSDVGTYTCNATNVLSSDTKSGVLTVNGEDYTLLYTILCQSYRSTLQLIAMNEFLLHVYSRW